MAQRRRAISWLRGKLGHSKTPADIGNISNADLVTLLRNNGGFPTYVPTDVNTALMEFYARQVHAGQIAFEESMARYDAVMRARTDSPSPERYGAKDDLPAKSMARRSARTGKKRLRNGVNANSPAFLESFAWRRARMEALKKHGARCMCCGATPADGVEMHVDHIKPRRDFPELALDPENLQVLCEVCNHGKGNWDQTDWRRRAPSA